MNRSKDFRYQVAGITLETTGKSHSRGSGKPVGCALLLAAMFLAAQVAAGQIVTGTPPFACLTPSTFDVVNNANLNVHFAIPIFSRAGIGIPFSYVLTFDNSIWSPVISNGSLVWTPVPNWGWRGVTEAQGGYVSYQQGR